MTAREEIERLVSGRHPDPHSLLGAHPSRSGVQIRVWRPAARAVVAHVGYFTTRILLNRKLMNADPPIFVRYPPIHADNRGPLKPRGYRPIQVLLARLLAALPGFVEGLGVGAVALAGAAADALQPPDACRGPQLRFGLCTGSSRPSSHRSCARSCASGPRVATTCRSAGP